MGAITGNGTRVLVRCPRRLNSRSYQDVLESGLIKLCDFQSVFVQDNAHYHKSGSTLKYLDAKQISLLSDWPHQSLDINIIENLWSILKAKVYKRCPKTAGELWSAIGKEYKSIDASAIIGLYDSIPKRLKAGLQSKGEHTKY